MLFYSGRMITSQESFSFGGGGEGEEDGRRRRRRQRAFVVGQTVLDRRDIVPTRRCWPEYEYDEDRCLLRYSIMCGSTKFQNFNGVFASRCLVKKTKQRLGCLHPRLALMLKLRKDIGLSFDKGQVIT